MADPRVETAGLEPGTDASPRLSPLSIDYVSPLPPVRSGIADYSVDLLQALQALEEPGVRLRIASVPEQPCDDDVLSEWQRVAFDQIGSEGHVPVYHMGNNTYHEPIYNAALERPGIVVLHDVFLHHLLQDRTLAKTGGVDAYIGELTADHGWVGAAVALPPRWSGFGRAGLFALPAHRTLLECQLGVVVHSEWARRFLLSEGITRPIVRVPMVMPVPELTAELEDRASSLLSSWGVPKGAFVLGSFGFQTPIKRTSTAIRALAQPGLEQLHLVVGGEVSVGVDLVAMADDLGVSERVHLVGFLPGELFSAAIRACDLSVNLRYPTAGETSASLLRVLALGRGAIVSDYAQFRDFSHDLVVRLPLGDDPQDPSPESQEVLCLATELRRLVADRDRVRVMGSAARDFVLGEHRPHKAAAAFAAALQALADPGVLGESLALGSHSDEPRRPSTLTWGRLESSLKVSGVDGWLPGELRTIEIELENQSFARFLAAKQGAGGVMLEVRLLGLRDGSVCDFLEGRPWLALLRDLEPGESCTMTCTLRRPLVSTDLEIEPYVVGGRGFSRCRGARYHRHFA